MFESGQDWELFGYDMRNLGRHFMAAWKDLLWSYDSPVRSRLDEPVLLTGPDANSIYQAGRPSQQIEASCSAVLLADEQALSRPLRLPLSVEPELEAVLALEVTANSPFSPDDTGFGWIVVGRDEQYMHLVLVIVSLSAAMTYVSQHYGSHDAHAQEVWVDVDGQMVVISGFGEGRRESLYRRRLIKVAAMVGVGALVLLLVAAVGAGFKKLEYERLSSVAARTTQDAEQATQLRSELVAANETISAVNTIAAVYPSAHLHLARLTELLGDDAYVERLSVTGLEIDLRGRAVDAAGIMELLTEQPGYIGVTAASPIRKIPGTDVEQFHLKIQLDGGMS
jgi:general secretion pathway protein L